MKYEFDFPYEIKTCQACPFMSLYKGSTHCAFAPYGERRSIKYDTCPLRVAGWHTGTPTEEGWYIVVENNDENTYEEMYWNGTVFDYYGKSFHHYDVKAWQRIEPFEEATE